MEVVFPGYFIVSPGTAYAEVSNLDQTFITKEGLGTGERITSENGSPIIRRPSFPFCVKLWLSPDVIISLRIGLGLSRLFKPSMLK